MSLYYTIPTTVGLAELAAAQAAGQAVPFTHIDLGDGNGAPVTPDPDRPALVNKVHRTPISRIVRDTDHPTWLIFEAAVPEEVPAQGTGWTVREVALIGGRVPDQVMATGSYAPVEKTTLADGQGRALLIRMVVVYANAAAVSLSVSPMAYVTAGYVQQLLAEHEAKADPHPQYTTDAEVAAKIAAQASDSKLFFFAHMN